MVHYCVDFLEDKPNLTNARVFFWGFNLMAYILPLSLSSIFYILLVRTLWEKKLISSKTSEKMKQRATRMVFTVILTFGLCWLPQNSRFFFKGLSYPEMSFWEKISPEVFFMLQTIAQVLAYANSCLNPILYGLLSERFREGVRDLWRRVRRQPRSGSANSARPMHEKYVNF